MISSHPRFFSSTWSIVFCNASNSSAWLSCKWSVNGSAGTYEQPQNKDAHGKHSNKVPLTTSHLHQGTRPMKSSSIQVAKTQSTQLQQDMCSTHKHMCTQIRNLYKSREETVGAQNLFRSTVKLVLHPKPHGGSIEQDK